MTIKRVMFHVCYLVEEKDQDSCVKRAKKMFNAEMKDGTIPSDVMKISVFPADSDKKD